MNNAYYAKTVSFFYSKINERRKINIRNLIFATNELSKLTIIYRVRIILPIIQLL